MRAERKAVNATPRRIRNDGAVVPRRAWATLTASNDGAAAAHHVLQRGEREAVAAELAASAWRAVRLQMRAGVRDHAELGE